jgi:hypothetical protein
MKEGIKEGRKGGREGKKVEERKIWWKVGRKGVGRNKEGIED